MTETQTAQANMPRLIVAWLWVGIPLAWGVIITCINAAKLFQ